MFTKLFNQGLKIIIEDVECTFNTVEEFDFALTGRTHVTYDRVQHTLDMNDDELRNEARGIRAVEQHFVNVLARAMEDETNIGTHFGGMDIKLFSHDHHWRAVIKELNRYGDEFDDYKRIALAKYMQYLSSRQAVVQAVYSDRKNRRLLSEYEVPEEGDAAMRETIIFDLSVDRPVVDTPLSRMPKGEAVVVPLEAGAEISLRMSKHPFRLVPGDTCLLLDEATEQSYPLTAGRNFIGRESAADINVDAHYRDVSRKHLLIQLEPDGTAQLTDLSSHGTFISPAYLDHTTGKTLH